MKKILSLIICFQILALPVFAEYDFSDEAQAEFDRQKNQQIHNAQSMDFSKKRNRTEIKNDQLIHQNPPTLLDEIQNNTYTQVKTQPLNGYIVNIPSGTSFQVTFDSGINSGSLEKNDRLTVRLTNDLRYNGKLVAPAGSLVYGIATDAQNAGFAYGSGMIELAFNEILTPDGAQINILPKKFILNPKVNEQEK